MLYQKSKDRNHDILLVTTSGNNNSNMNLRFAARKSWCNKHNFYKAWYIYLYIYWLIFIVNVWEIYQHNPIHCYGYNMHEQLFL